MHSRACTLARQRRFAQLPAPSSAACSHAGVASRGGVGREGPACGARLAALEPVASGLAGHAAVSGAGPHFWRRKRDTIRGSTAHAALHARRHRALNSFLHSLSGGDRPADTSKRHLRRFVYVCVRARARARVCVCGVRRGLSLIHI
eukprot:2936558-Alexandrium_andersonii.AAC.1